MANLAETLSLYSRAIDSPLSTSVIYTEISTQKHVDAD